MSVATSVGTQRVRAQRADRWAWLATGAIVVLVAALVAVVALSASLAGRGASAERDAAVVEVARRTMLALVEQDPARVQRHLDDALILAAGPWRAQLAADAPGMVEAVRAAGIESRGILTEAGLRTVADDHAEVLVAAQVQTGGAGTPAASPRPVHALMGLERRDEGWRVTDLEVVP